MRPHANERPPDPDQAKAWQTMFRSCWAGHGREPHAELWNRATGLVREIVPAEFRPWFYTSTAWREFMEHYEAHSQQRADDHRPAGRQALRVHTVRWPHDTHEALQQIAHAMGCSLNELTLRTMAALISEHPETRKDATPCQPTRYKGSLTSKT